MTSVVTGIVLAGGKSRRLGRNKAIEPIGGKPLIWRVIGLLSCITDQTVVVVNEKEAVSVLPMPDATKVALDIYPNSGALGGIFTGLSVAESKWSVVVACDMPFLSLTLIEHMLTLTDGYDVVVPVLQDRLEPIHALYSKACLPHMERQLQSRRLKIVDFFADVKVNYLTQEEVEKKDPQHLSFFNVNTREDLDRARALFEKGR